MNVVKSKLNLLNRELGAIEFNRRVLALAENLKIPLLERLKYICIVSSNLDEFFEIRIAVLKEQLRKILKAKRRMDSSWLMRTSILSKKHRPL